MKSPETNAKRRSFVADLATGEPRAVARCPLSLAHWSKDGDRILATARELDISVDRLMPRLLGDAADEAYIGAVVDACVEHMVNDADVLRTASVRLVEKHAKCLRLETLAQVAQLVVSQVRYPGYCR